MIFIILLSVLIIGLFTLYRSNPKKKFLPPIVLILFNILIIEIFIYGYFLYQIHTSNSFLLIGHQKILDNLIKTRSFKELFDENNQHNRFYEFDKNTGYTVGKNKSYAIYQSNNQGMRANKDFTKTPSKKTLRMATFGDSFVFGDGEVVANIWQTILEQRLGNLEVLNFGVSGYGMSQSYLRYINDGLPFNPDIIFFNYITLGNRDRIDLKSILSGTTNLKSSTMYRPLLYLEKDILKSKGITPLDFFNKDFQKESLYSPIGLKKFHAFWHSPIMSQSNTAILIKQLLLKKMISSTQLNKKSLDLEIKINAHMLKILLTTAQKNNTSIIFFVPVDFKDLHKDIQTILNKFSKNIIVINSSRALSETAKANNLTKDKILNRTNHYNSQGNFLYSQIIFSILKRRVWGEGNRIFEFNTEKNEFQHIALD